MSATCRANNPLLCFEHGLALDFTEVPKYVKRDVNRLARLFQAEVLSQSELDSAALLEGVLPSEVGWVSFHHPDGAVALRNLVLKAHAAAEDFSAERQRQAANSLAYVTAQIHERLPRYSEDVRYLLTNLVTLRFLIAERDWENSEEGYLNTFGISREELFAPMGDRKVRQLLMACDRAYLMSTTALIPEPKELQALAHERFLRYRGPISTGDTERALELLGEAFTRHIEDWGGVEGEADWDEAEDV